MEQEQMRLFQSGKVSVAVLKNAIPAMIAMLMVLIYSFVHTARNNQQAFDLFIGSSIMKSYMKDG